MLGVGAIALATAGILVACAPVGATHDYRPELDQAISERDQARQDLSTAQANLDAAEESLAAAIQDRNAAQATLNTTLIALNDANVQRDNLKNALWMTQDELTAVRAQITILEAQVASLNTTIQNLDTTITGLNANITNYRNQIEKYRDIIGDMQAVMDVVNMIGALPNNITIADWAAVAAANAAFDDLTTLQKAMVTTAFVQRLQNANIALSNVNAVAVGDFNSDGRGTLESIEDGVRITGNAWSDGAVWSVNTELESMVFDIASTLENNQFATFIISFNNLAGTHAGENRFGVAKYNNNLYFGTVGGVNWASPEAAAAGQIAQIRNGVQVASNGQVVVNFDFNARVMNAKMSGEELAWQIPSSAKTVRALWVLTNTATDLTNIAFSERAGDLGLNDFEAAGRGTVVQIENGVRLTFNDSNGDGPFWRADAALDAITFNLDADIQNGQWTSIIFSFNNFAGNHAGEMRLGFARDNSGQLFVRMLDGISWGNLDATYNEILGGTAIDSLNSVGVAFNYGTNVATLHASSQAFTSAIPGAAVATRSVWVVGTANSVDLTQIRVF